MRRLFLIFSKIMGSVTFIIYNQQFKQFNHPSVLLSISLTAKLPKPEFFFEIFEFIIEFRGMLLMHVCRIISTIALMFFALNLMHVCRIISMIALMSFALNLSRQFIVVVLFLPPLYTLLSLAPVCIMARAGCMASPH